MNVKKGRLWSVVVDENGEATAEPAPEGMSPEEAMDHAIVNCPLCQEEEKLRPNRAARRAALARLRRRRN